MKYFKYFVALVLITVVVEAKQRKEILDKDFLKVETIMERPLPSQESYACFLEISNILDKYNLTSAGYISTFAAALFYVDEKIGLDPLVIAHQINYLLQCWKASHREKDILISEAKELEAH